jgi:hypothetical protein
VIAAGNKITGFPYNVGDDALGSGAGAARRCMHRAIAGSRCA